MTVPYIFADIVGPIPVSDLDVNFATPATIGSTPVALGQTVSTLAGVTLTGATLTTPALGTPTGGNLTNCTFPTLNQNTTGTATNVTGVVPVLNGGTGITSPSLISGTNVTIAGTWPNQTISATGGGGTGMTYPGAGIGNSTGTAWDTSYSTSGTGTVVALTASPTFTTPALGTPTSGNLANCTFPTLNQSTTGNATTATNISGGIASQIPYQTGANTTAFVPNGTSGQVLTSNGTTAPSWAAAASGMTYPGAGIGNSTGSAWGTSYTTSGTGTVLALTASPTFTSPTLGTPASGNLANCSFPTLNQSTTGNALTATSAGSVPYSGLTGAVPTWNQSTTGNALTATTATTANALNTGNDYQVATINSTALNLATSPTANPTGGVIATTYSSLVAQTTTSHGTTNREWVANFGLTNNAGYGAANNNGDKVTLYAGMDMVANSGDGWAFNTVTTVNSTAPALCKAYGYELDFNNLQSHRDNYGAGSLFGLGVTGAGSFRSTAAILVSGVTPIWQRGLAIGSVVNNSIEDTSNSVTCWAMYGTHTYGIDLSSGVYSQFFNLADNAYSLGSSGKRWSSVWAANGTIQTSDINSKKDIVDSPLGLDFINTLRPVAYKFKVGGQIPDPDHVSDESNKKAYIPVAGTRQHFGLIAQEVKEVLPEGVDFGGWIQIDKTDVNSEQGLRYEEFIAPLIQAVKELSKELTAVKIQLAALTNNQG